MPCGPQGHARSRRSFDPSPFRTKIPDAGANSFSCAGVSDSSIAARAVDPILHRWYDEATDLSPVFRVNLFLGVRLVYWPAPDVEHSKGVLVEVADLLLVERCKQDDIEAYEMLVERYRNKILNYVARYCGSADAEDLTQEVFIKAFVAIKKFRGSAVSKPGVPDCQQRVWTASGG